MDEHQTAQKALRSTQGGVAFIQLADELSRLRQRLESSNEDRQAANLVKDYGLNVMLMLLKKGARLHEHRTKGPLTVQVVSGVVLFVAANSHNELAVGTILAVDRDVPHRLEALEESVLLLTTALG
jgi:quercetin dioxygenase-like cupin family protein